MFCAGEKKTCWKNECNAYLVNVKPHIILPAVLDEVFIFMLVTPNIDNIGRVHSCEVKNHRCRCLLSQTHAAKIPIRRLRDGLALVYLYFVLSLQEELLAIQNTMVGCICVYCTRVWKSGKDVSYSPTIVYT